MFEAYSWHKEAFEARRGEERRGIKVTCHYLNGWYAHRDDSPLLREACAWRELLENIVLPIYPDERIPGMLVAREPVMFHYSSGTYIDERGAQEYIAQEALSGDALRAFEERLRDVEERRYHAANPQLFTPEENASIRAYAASSTWFGGHMVIDYHTILTQGLEGYQRDVDAARAAHPDKVQFYRAMEEQLSAIRIFIRRYARRAAEVAENAAFDTRAFKAMAMDLADIADAPPATFRQGLTLVWILHMLNGADSFGRFDDYLLPLFERDRAAGVLSTEEAAELLYCLCLKIEEVNQIQNMTIGGVNADGTAQYTQLTKWIIDATAAAHYKGPNLCLRVTRDMPKEIWQSALACLGTGIGLPALYNDEIYIGNFTRMGVDARVARGYCLAGCSQVMLPGQCNFVNDIGIFNAAKVLELTLHDGYDARTDAQVGLHTRHAADFESFNQLMDAFERQMDYFCELEASINDKDILYRNRYEGYTMRTLFMQDCIARGKSIFDGGARYNHIELEVIGITNCADSLHAIRQAVYERKFISMSALLDALASDFEGHEALRLYLRERTDKFGNNVDAVDALRARIAGRIFETFNKRPSVLGGVYVPGEVIFVAHEGAGSVVGATPEGRRAYTVLADSAGASQGMDRTGPTALLNSVLTIPTNHLLTSVVLNLRFTAALFTQSGVEEKMGGMIDAFFRNGGMQVQINVCDAEELRRALERPEDYRSLVVRVGGYSDYFVNLSHALQQEIIRRTEYAV